VKCYFKKEKECPVCPDVSVGTESKQWNPAPDGSLCLACRLDEFVALCRELFKMEPEKVA